MNGLALDPRCVHCDEPIAAGAQRLHYGVTIVRGVPREISAHLRCVSFHMPSAHAMQGLILTRIHA